MWRVSSFFLCLMKNRLNNKIKKLCHQIEKEFGAKVICGNAIVGKKATTIPVSISTSRDKKTITSAYNQPVGLIEIRGKKIKFISTVKRKSVLRTVIKIFVLVVGVLGITSAIQSDDKWDSD